MTEQLPYIIAAAIDALAIMVVIFAPTVRRRYRNQPPDAGLQKRREAEGETN